jgi:hypothetical protein
MYETKAFSKKTSHINAMIITGTKVSPLPFLCEEKKENALISCTVFVLPF